MENKTTPETEEKQITPKKEEKEDKNQKKRTIENIINKENIKILLELAKKYGKIIKDFFGDKEHEKAVVSIIAVVMLSFFGFSIAQVISQNKTLTKETKNLDKLEKYNIQSLKDNASIQNIVSAATNISDLLEANKTIQDESKRYEDHKKELQSSYSNFLQYLLVPKLNVRKEAYTDKINLDLLGKNFLEKNPFNDINLYQRWSNFFSSTEKNQNNTIEDLKIGEIIESDYGLYKIKVSFSFITPTKNALLFLADKISITSDKENISLIGEFAYYLRQQIKNDKTKEIEELKKDLNNTSIANSDDKIIGKELYKWINGKDSSSLIDDKVINKTIKSIMECGGENESECFYKFREKYRNIGELAYTIGSSNNINKSSDLKIFFQSMPPLMTVQNFTFNTKEDNAALNATVQYEGKIDLEIYGQNIPTNEIQEIAKELGKKCFGTEEELSPSLGITKITNSSKKELDTTDGDYTKVSRASEFKSILESIDKEYAEGSNYKKTIRLFEVYRMLNEGGFCTTI